MKKSGIRKCALCLKEKELCNSHIIPEFFYKPLYDEKHRLQLIPSINEEKTHYEQKGLRENLLCEECEEQLSRFEKYTSQLFYGGMGVYVTNENPIRIEGIDYKKFKLFQLSLIFRASVSNLDFFEKINLGPHEEKIRKMLIDENPGGENDYPCLVLIPKMKGRPMSDELILTPEEIKKFEGHRQYRFILGGCFWVYIVSSHTSMFSFKKFFLKENGKLLIPIERADRFLNALARDMLKFNGKV
jgi:hypothetical protein